MKFIRLSGNKNLTNNYCGVDFLNLNKFNYINSKIYKINDIKDFSDIIIAVKSNYVIMDIAEIEKFALNCKKSYETNFGYIIKNNNKEFEKKDFFKNVYDLSNINSLNKLMEQIRLEIIEKHLKNGVIFESFDMVYIDANVKIGKGTTISANNKIVNNSVIGENCIIENGCVINNAVVNDEAYIQSSKLIDCQIGKKTTVGPFANIHTNSKIDAECRIGDFVEIKNSSLGFNTKSAHLAYIGDTDIGYKCNIGCGVIFVNYDGANKFRSSLGNGVFIGSNSNVVAPVNIEDGAYVAAGSTVTCNLPGNCMCIARSREVIKENRSKYKKL